MKLGDIQFYLEYQKNLNYINHLRINCNKTESEAIVEDYNKNCKNNRARLRKESQCITELFVRLLKEYKITFNSFSKIVINCKDNRNIQDKIEIIDKICFFSVNFDSLSYFKMNNYEKKRYLFFIVCKCIDLIADESDRNMDIHKIYNIIESKNYNNIYTYSQKNFKNHHINIIVEHDIEKANIWLSIINKYNNNIKAKILLKSCEPNYWIISNFLFKIKIEKKKHIYIMINKKIYAQVNYNEDMTIFKIIYS